MPTEILHCIDTSFKAFYCLMGVTGHHKPTPMAVQDEHCRHSPVNNTVHFARHVDSMPVVPPLPSDTTTSLFLTGDYKPLNLQTVSERTRTAACIEVHAYVHGEGSTSCKEHRCSEALQRSQTVTVLAEHLAESLG